MNPARKKAKTNPQVDVDGPTNGPNKANDMQQHGTVHSISDAAPTSDAGRKAGEQSQTASAASRSSWYGSWRSKASPVAQIARESISVAKGATTESSEDARRPRSVSKSARGRSRKSIPLAAEATCVHATSEASGKSASGLIPREKAEQEDQTSESKRRAVVEEASMPLAPRREADDDSKSLKNADVQRPQSGGWFGWWSRPDGYGSDVENSNKKLKLDVEEGANTHPPRSPPVESADKLSKKGFVPEEIGHPEGVSLENNARVETTTSYVQSKSWFGLWSSTQNQQSAEDEQAIKDIADSTAPDITTLQEPAPNAESVKKEDSLKVEDADTATEQAKPSGWAFWSSDRTKEPVPTPNGTQKQIGELAVADTPSQSNPEAAQFNEQRERTKPAAANSASLLRQKNGKKSAEVSVALTSVDQTLATGQIPTSSALGGEDSIPAKAAVKGKAIQHKPNLVSPSFEDNFPKAPNPGYVERLTHYLAQSLHLPGSQPIPSPQHIFAASSLPRIKKAVALGIHGFFPAPLIQKVLGQPTGTSIRFANYAASSIKTWCREWQPDVKDVEIEKVALEGEGYIADRVTTLWKLLLNWLNHLRQADFIFVACHSQGVPVAMMLVAKLIELGCLNPHVRIGVCAMAGINLGPFPEYRSRLFGGSALELFDFGDAASKVSKAYAESLDKCLRHGVRLTFVGSIDDQLVSLESSLHTPVFHPYICRAVFIDGRFHKPNFLTRLVVFALKLRNLGVSDHGLIRELSAPLAGSLVGGEGHSRVYDDSAVYALAISFALQSTDAPTSDSGAFPSTSQADRNHTKVASSARRSSLAKMPSSSPTNTRHIRRTSLTATTNFAQGIAPVFAPYEPPPSTGNANPFYLPWAVRGMLEESIVKQEMNEEVDELVKEFEKWRPASKVLKDVRWRLEGIRSMLW